MAEKARLRRSGKEVVDNIDQPQLAMPGTEEIVETREQPWASIIAGWFRSVGFFLVGTGFILVVLYLGLAATILFWANPAGHGLIVARGTFVGNIAPTNSQVYISTTQPDSDAIIARIKTGILGAPNAAVVKIRSGLYDSVSVTNGRVLVNGKDAGAADGLHVSGSGSVRLDNQYLTRCEYGACQANTWVLVPKAQVYGEVKRG